MRITHFPKCISGIIFSEYTHIKLVDVKQCLLVLINIQQFLM